MTTAMNQRGRAIYEDGYREGLAAATPHIKAAERATFAASWERMVLLATYVGPSDEWGDRFFTAYCAMSDAPNNGPNQTKGATDNA